MMCYILFVFFLIYESLTFSQNQNWIKFSCEYFFAWKITMSLINALEVGSSVRVASCLLHMRQINKPPPSLVSRSPVARKPDQHSRGLLAWLMD